MANETDALSGANASDSQAGSGAAGGTTSTVAGTSAGQASGQTFTGAGHEQVIDIGVDETKAFELGAQAGQTTFDEGLRRLNAKRTYDLHQSQDLRTSAQHQAFDLVSLGNAQGHAQRVSQIAEQALQNAVETSNMVAKQAVRHGDLAIDRQWNVNETDLAAVAAHMATVAAAMSALAQRLEPKA